MNDVAIIGVGLHPFGRFEGKTAMEMGVDAIFAAVADAGVEWKDVQFATGGSWTVANPDAIVGMVGLTGIPFTNVFNACATAASAAAAILLRSGASDCAISVSISSPSSSSRTTSASATAITAARFASSNSRTSV